MRDLISIHRANELHPAVRQEVIDTINEIEKGLPLNAKVRIAQGLRTIEYQNELYTLGRTKVNPDGKSKNKPMGNIVTKAKGGSSYHNYGNAFDFCLVYDNKGVSWDLIKDFDADGIKDWDEVVNAFKAKGWEFGGDWKSLKDYPHLQKTFGVHWQTLYYRYSKKDFISGTTYVRLI